MQRERGKKKQKPKQDPKVRAGGKIGGPVRRRQARWARRRARVGRWEKTGGTVGKRQRGNKMSNKQEKAKCKEQEVNSSNDCPPFFWYAPPSRLIIFLVLKPSHGNKGKHHLFKARLGFEASRGRTVGPGGCRGKERVFENRMKAFAA